MARPAQVFNVLQLDFHSFCAKAVEIETLVTVDSIDEACNRTVLLAKQFLLLFGSLDELIHFVEEALFEPRAPEAIRLVDFFDGVVLERPLQVGVAGRAVPVELAFPMGWLFGVIFVRLLLLQSDSGLGSWVALGLLQSAAQW